MTNKEIIEKAIQKAIDGGWDKWGWLHFEVDDTALYITFANKKITYRSAMFITKEVYSVIFNKDFAKALWGEKKIHIQYQYLDKRFYYEHDGTHSEGDEGIEAPAYLLHLQQMVIAEDPIKYLSEHFNG